jgi:hypothetical protein
MATYRQKKQDLELRKKTFQEVRDPLFFSALPFTGLRRHSSLTSGFSDRFTHPQHLRCARAALAF